MLTRDRLRAWAVRAFGGALWIRPLVLHDADTDTGGAGVGA